MQIVTKLPNENIQNYQLAMFWGGVNYQMQIVTKLPNENIQNYQLEMIDSGRGDLHLVIYPLQNQTFLVGSFGYFIW